MALSYVAVLHPRIWMETSRSGTVPHIGPYTPPLPHRNYRKEAAARCATDRHGLGLARAPLSRCLSLDPARFGDHRRHTSPNRLLGPSHRPAPLLADERHRPATPAATAARPRSVQPGEPACPPRPST